jgi:hypothetical protein
MMKNLLITVAILALTSCKHGAQDNKNENSNYPTYDTTQKMENINKGPENTPANEPSSADPNHTGH